MAEPKEVKTVSKRMVSAENSSFKLESGLIWLFFLHEYPAKSKIVIMNKICRVFMIKFEKAKINFYWIRAEKDFIVFLQKIHETVLQTH